MGCHAIEFSKENKSRKTTAMTPFDCYKTYLAIKQHFTQPTYDYFRYHGATKGSVVSFNKRKDKYFFEKMTRQKTDSEIKEYFLANFVYPSNPQSVWIGEIIKQGETNYNNWLKINQSLAYYYKEDLDILFDTEDFKSVMECKGHPKLLKKYLSGKINLETLVIMNKILNFVPYFDNKLKDPVWETVSLKIKKYTPFLNINVHSCQKMLKEATSQ